MAISADLRHALVGGLWASIKAHCFANTTRPIDQAVAEEVFTRGCNPNLVKLLQGAVTKYLPRNP